MQVGFLPLLAVICAFCTVSSVAARSTCVVVGDPSQSSCARRGAANVTLYCDTPSVQCDLVSEPPACVLFKSVFGTMRYHSAEDGVTSISSSVENSSLAVTYANTCVTTFRVQFTSPTPMRVAAELNEYSYEYSVSSSSSSDDGGRTAVRVGGALLLVIVGAIPTFAGYRVFKAIIFMSGCLPGFASGSMAALAVLSGMSDMGGGIIALGILVGLLIGVMCGYIALALFYCTIACIGFQCGVMLAYFLLTAIVLMTGELPHTVVAILLIVFSGIGCMVVAVKMVKLVVVCVTASVGGWVMAVGVALLSKCDPLESSWRSGCNGDSALAVVAVCALLLFAAGVVIQYRWTGKGDRHSQVQKQQRGGNLSSGTVGVQIVHVQPNQPPQDQAALQQQLAMMQYMMQMQMQMQAQAPAQAHTQTQPLMQGQPLFSQQQQQQQQPFQFTNMPQAAMLRYALPQPEHAMGPLQQWPQPGSQAGDGAAQPAAPAQPQDLKQGKPQDP